MNFKEEDEASFYKILISDSEYLPLPSAFANKFMKQGDNKKQRVVLETQSGDEWSAKYIKIEDRFYFMGGWLKFMKENGIQFGDFLVFWLRSFDPYPVFEVFIYSPNGCIKHSSDDDTGLCNEKKPSVESGSVKLEDVEGSLTLQKSVKVSYRHRMPLNWRFVKATGINGYDRLRLANNKGKMWDVSLKRGWEKQAPVIGAGWFDFMKDNKVTVGNSCVFTHVQDNILRVHVIKNKKRGRRNGVKSKGS